MAKKKAVKKAATRAKAKGATAKKTVTRAAKRAVKRAPAGAARKTARKKVVSRAKAGTGPARNVVVVVGDSDLPQIEKVATQLRSRGMKVDSVLESTGMITGTTAKKPAALSRVKGVTAVEEATPIQLPPPGSDIQ